MTITRQEALGLESSIFNFYEEGPRIDQKLFYALDKNAKALFSANKHYKNKIDELNLKVKKAQEEHCTRKENGDILLIKGKMQGLTESSEYLDKLNNIQDERKEFLAETIEFDVFLFDESFYPVEKMKGKHYELLEIFVKKVCVQEKKVDETSNFVVQSSK